MQEGEEEEGQDLSALYVLLLLQSFRTLEDAAEKIKAQNR